MNSKTEDFPTPVSPTRRILYGVCASFFDVLMIALLIDSKSLANTIRIIALKMEVAPYLIVMVLSSSSSSKTFSRG